MNKQHLLSIDISHLSTDSRSASPSCIDASRDGPVVSPPVDGKEATAKVKLGIDVPADIFGYQYAHGTSAFASGVAGLEYSRSALVGFGLDRSEVDLVTSTHVEILATTVPFILEFDNPKVTQRVTDELFNQARRVGLKTRSVPHEYGIEVYGVLPNSDLLVSSGALSTLADASSHTSMTVRSQPEVSLIRINLALSEFQLRLRHWHHLENWRNAYPEGRYQQIFNEFVRGLLRLDNPIHYEKPSPELMVSMGLQSAKVLRDYLDGKDLKVVSDFAVGRPKGKISRAYNNCRRELLAYTGFDISVPWAEHKSLLPKLLWSKLMYQGDYQPKDAGMSGHFCKAEWPTQLLRLKRDGFPTFLAQSKTNKRSFGVHEAAKTESMEMVGGEH